MAEPQTIKTDWINKQLRSENFTIVTRFDRRKPNQVQIMFTASEYKTIEVPVNEAGSILIKKTGNNLIGFLIKDVFATFGLPRADWVGVKPIDPEQLLLGFGFTQNEKGDWQYTP